MKFVGIISASDKSTEQPICHILTSSAPFHMMEDLAMQYTGYVILEGYVVLPDILADGLANILCGEFSGQAMSSAADDALFAVASGEVLKHYPGLWSRYSRYTGPNKERPGFSCSLEELKSKLLHQVEVECVEANHLVDAEPGVDVGMSIGRISGGVSYVLATTDQNGLPL